MARFGLAITKSVSFRGVQQEFSNVYYYNSPTVGIPTDPTALINEVVAIERDLHSSDVTFVRSMLWSQIGSPGQNQMLDQRALSGTGNQSTLTTLDRERAFLMQWPAGLDSRGHPVKLRKWFHSCGSCAGQSIPTTTLQQTAALSEAARDAISNRMNDLRIIGAADEWLLVAKNGREHTGPGRVHRWLEHRQLGDMWR